MWGSLGETLGRARRALVERSSAPNAWEFDELLLLDRLHLPSGEFGYVGIHQIELLLQACHDLRVLRGHVPLFGGIRQQIEKSPRLAGIAGAHAGVIGRLILFKGRQQGDTIRAPWIDPALAGCSVTPLRRG